MVTAPADGECRVAALRAVEELEFRRLHVKTVVLQELRDIVDTGVVAGSAVRSVVAVGVGDLLQLLQVGVHAVRAHLARKFAGQVR